MQPNKYESIPFQQFMKIHNFSPIGCGLKERNDFNNINSLNNNRIDKINLPKLEEENEQQRNSYLTQPTKKLWESDWTLLIPETHKDNGNLF